MFNIQTFQHPGQRDPEKGPLGIILNSFGSKVTSEFGQLSADLPNDGVRFTHAALAYIPRQVDRFQSHR